MNTSRKLTILAAFVFGAAALLAAEDRGSFDRTLTVSGPVELSVQSGSGHIHVHAGPGGTVVIHGEIRAGWSLTSGNAAEQIHRVEQNPPIEQNGNKIRVGHTDDSDLLRNLSISYEVTVPAETQLSARTGSGGIEVGGLKGEVTGAAGSGGIRVADIGSNVALETGSGGIDVESVTGNLSARAGSGGIKAKDVGGASGTAARIEVKTGSGGIKLEQARGSLVAQAGSGPINVSGVPTGNWEVHSGSGGVELLLPAKAEFDLRARTGSGGISVEFPITMQGSVGDKHRVEGKVGGGGPMIDVNTGSGGVHIKPGASEPL